MAFTEEVRVGCNAAVSIGPRANRPWKDTSIFPNGFWDDVVTEGSSGIFRLVACCPDCRWEYEPRFATVDMPFMAW